MSCDARLRIAPVAKLPAMRAQAIAERALLGREVLRCFRLADAKLRHGLARAGLSHTPRLLDGGLKVLAKRPVKRCHSCAPQFTNTGPSATFDSSIVFCRSIQASTSAGSRSVERSSVTV